MWAQVCSVCERGWGPGRVGSVAAGDLEGGESQWLPPAVCGRRGRVAAVGLVEDCDVRQSRLLPGRASPPGLSTTVSKSAWAPVGSGPEREREHLPRVRLVWWDGTTMAGVPGAQGPRRGRVAAAGVRSVLPALAEWWHESRVGKRLTRSSTRRPSRTMSSRCLADRVDRGGEAEGQRLADLMESGFGGIVDQCCDRSQAAAGSVK